MSANRSRSPGVRGRSVPPLPERTSARPDPHVSALQQNVTRLEPNLTQMIGMMQTLMSSQAAASQFPPQQPGSGPFVQQVFGAASSTQVPQVPPGFETTSPERPPRVQPGGAFASPTVASPQEDSGFFERFQHMGAEQHALTNGGSRRSMEVDDRGSLSRADKWLSPIEKPKAWKGRLEEIIGFQSYFTYLQSWLGNLSNKYPREMTIAKKSVGPILQGSLSAAEAIRSVRLQSLLMQMFSDVGKAQILLLAYVESTDEVCGYESLRLLCKEYSLYSLTEALPFRNKILGKSFKENSVTELFSVFDLEVARYNRLIASLDHHPGQETSRLTDADLSTIILRSLPEKCRGYVVLGLQSSAFVEVRTRAMDWEHRHRCWNELEKPNLKQLNNETLNEFQGKGDDNDGGKPKGKYGKKGPKGGKKGKTSKGFEGKSKGKSKHSAGGKTGKGKAGGCFLCGGPSHYAKDCPKGDAIAKQVWRKRSYFQCLPKQIAQGWRTQREIQRETSARTAVG